MCVIDYILLPLQVIARTVTDVLDRSLGQAAAAELVSHNTKQPDPEG